MSKKTPKSKVAIIWMVMINTVLIVFILTGLLIAISLIPFKDNYRILVVMSGSMEPTIYTGSLVIVKPVNEYKVNDIITFKTPGSQRKNDFTTHRIHDIESSDSGIIYITKGDANEEPDFERIAENRIIGKQFYSIALLGYVIGYVKTLPGLLIIIIVPAVIIIYEEVNKIKKEAVKIIKNRKKLKKAKNGKDIQKD